MSDLEIIDKYFQVNPYFQADLQEAIEQVRNGKVVSNEVVRAKIQNKIDELLKSKNIS
jgi:hypothetical protein